MGTEDHKLSNRKVRFRDIPAGQWFRVGQTVFQKLKNLNGANCYQWDRGYRYFNPRQVVVPISKPEITVEALQRPLKIIGHLYEDMRLDFFPPE